ncbi:MAG TPA: hypothetical protein VFS59_11295 [Gemmatimonadaceae bacterium]|nr:hypothetical protein [Gemmatimonadaceae bacterium]
MNIGRVTMRRISRSVSALALALSVCALAAPATLAAQGRLRELGCRGGPGLSFRVDLNPSPRDTTYVVMQMDYRPSVKAVSYDYKSLDPGTCTWNPTRAAGYPAEPGSVRFDIKRIGQPWPAKDTTIRAGAWFPDPVSMPRYLGDARHYYKFYVYDSTRFANSFGVIHESAQPVFVMTSGPLMVDPTTKREIRCRGGTGLMFGGGGSIGPNVASVTMSYRTSANLPGQSGSGLSAGSCAWVDRIGVPNEPGKVTFTTASNAQLKQIQSGSTVDRSPTAAVRYPDVNTIPAYLVDPAHYWTFTVTAGAPDKASIHGAWIPPLNVATTLATARATAGATTVSRPTTSTGSSVYTPGAGNVTVSQPAPTGAGSSVLRPGTGTASTTSRVGTLFDIRNVTATPGLEDVVISFEAAANSNPAVTITPASVGATMTLAVTSAPASAGMMRYVAKPGTKLPRNMSYNFGILAAATGNARQNSTSGTFRTLSQRVTINISEINLINDGDADSDGELVFDFDPCTNSISTFRIGSYAKPVSWGDGPQWVVVDLKSTAEVPDQLRILVGGVEDDWDVTVWGSRSAPTLTCARPLRPPGKNSTGEWNSLILDVDLTKYPGPKNGATFVRRSQPPCCGTKLEFEIKGKWEVTRQ